MNRTASATRSSLFIIPASRKASSLPRNSPSDLGGSTTPTSSPAFAHSQTY